MKKFLIFLFALVLFTSAYYVRVGFLATKDYNEPSDANEYRASTNNAVLAVKSTRSLNDLSKTFPWLTESLDVHSAPVTVAYFTIINLFFSGNKDNITTVMQSLFVVFLFFVIKKLLNTWVAMVVSLVAVVYTPLFSYLYSYMPESFGGFFVSTMSVIAVFFALKAHRSPIFTIFTGIILGLVALYRIELRWVGIPFVVVWFLSQPLKKNMIHALLMFIPYAFLVGGWFMLSHLFNPTPYYTGGNTHGVLYNTYNWKTFGWIFDTAPVTGWSLNRILDFILSQGIFQIGWLQFALPIRLFTRPATAYIGEYLIPDSYLFSLHALLVGLALFGLRKAFFNKVFFFLAVILIWVSFLSFNPEELRRQIPLLGIMLIFAGAGLYEIVELFKKSKNFFLLSFLIIIFLFHVLSPQIFYNSIFSLFPWLTNAFFIRILFLIIEILLLIYIAKKLYLVDKGKRALFNTPFLRRMPSLVPVIISLILTSYQLRSPSWHEFSRELLNQAEIKQNIVINAKNRNLIKGERGYLLVDIKDPNAGKYLKVQLNNKVLEEKLSLKRSMSPIDLLVHRQFQRGMPRIGWGGLEDQVASSSAFPNMHQWLIFPIKGDYLLEVNSVIIKNTSTSKNPPLIFGDYFSSFDKQVYDGPTGRIFQGPGSFFKFQVDGDRRLPELRILYSDKNITQGMKNGRYRIFLLFSYPRNDPEYLF